MLIVDGHPKDRALIRSLVNSCNGLRVVGEASTGEEALGMARTMLPDVLVTDFELTGMDGLRVTQILQKEIPKIKVVLLTIHNTREHLWRVMQAGVYGYLKKETTSARLAELLGKVAADDLAFNRRKVPLRPSRALVRTANRTGVDPRSGRKRRCNRLDP